MSANPRCGKGRTPRKRSRLRRILRRLWRVARIVLAAGAALGPSPPPPPLPAPPPMEQQGDGQPGSEKD
ncbi:MAG: hypothetical protein JW940_04270 [Polyangiaceae bacterium]|nr:hypothetical protein [Polyangiaceae bacterium]